MCERRLKGFEAAVMTTKLREECTNFRGLLQKYSEKNKSAPLKSGALCLLGLKVNDYLGDVSDRLKE